MVFSSAIFLFAFLPAVFLLYRVVPGQKAKNILLAASSVVFYAFGQLEFVPLFLASVLINYLSGLALMRANKRRKLILALSVLLNIGILCYYKYTDFAIGNINRVLGTAIPARGIILPIGISFFTFQGLSYSIDVYRDPATGTRDPLKLLLYISFFPQLIAGPIVKYHDISEQIDRRSCTPEQTAYGVRRFIVGLSKKILVANALGYIVDRIFVEYIPAGVYDPRLMWLAAVCYTLQIYYDFSGYSDMAIGIGRMFGFTFRENFEHPYGSSSIKEFWRRWHISLSSWFKEYLYIPLGGNRRGRARTVLNKLIVFFCTGIWHGANWTFVLWGMLHGLLSSLEDIGAIPTKKLCRFKIGTVVSKLCTLLAVMLLFVIFRSDSITQAFAVISGMFAGAASPDVGYVLRTLLDPAAVFVLTAAVLLAGNIPVKIGRFVSETDGSRRAALEGLASVCCIALYALCMMSLARGGFNPFIYFQF